jgi:hypothetical protein
MPTQQVLDILQPLRTQMLELIEQAGVVTAAIYDDCKVVKDAEGFWQVCEESREKLVVDEISLPMLAHLAQAAAADLALTPEERVLKEQRAAKAALYGSRKKAADEIVSLDCHAPFRIVSRAGWTDTGTRCWKKAVVAVADSVRLAATVTVEFDEGYKVITARLVSMTGVLLGDTYPF